MMHPERDRGLRADEDRRLACGVAALLLVAGAVLGVGPFLGWSARLWMGLGVAVVVGAIVWAVHTAGAPRG